MMKRLLYLLASYLSVKAQLAFKPAANYRTLVRSADALRHDDSLIRHRAVKTFLSRSSTKESLLFHMRGGGEDSSMPLALTSSKSDPALPTAPRLSTWILPGLSCALAYALYNIFIKRASSAKMDPMLGGVLLQFVAAIFGSIMYIAKAWLASSRMTTNVSSSWSKAGIVWSVAAGVSVGIAEILSFYVSSKGVQAMQSIPVIIGGSVLLGTVLGSVWLKEAITWRGWLGVMLISVGIGIVGMDPGSTVH